MKCIIVLFLLCSSPLLAMQEKQSSTSPSLPPCLLFKVHLQSTQLGTIFTKRLGYDTSNPDLILNTDEESVYPEETAADNNQKIYNKRLDYRLTLTVKAYTTRTADIEYTVKREDKVTFSTPIRSEFTGKYGTISRIIQPTQKITIDIYDPQKQYAPEAPYTPYTATFRDYSSTNLDKNHTITISTYAPWLIEGQLLKIGYFATE